MVFNCQLGAGRTTTGTVIGGLLDMYAAAASDPALPPAVAASGGAGAGVAVVSMMRKAPSVKALEELPLAALAEAMQGGSPRSGAGGLDRGGGGAALGLPGRRGRCLHAFLACRSDMRQS
jgi:hypothetical protein